MLSPAEIIYLHPLHGIQIVYLKHTIPLFDFVFRATEIWNKNGQACLSKYQYLIS